MPIMSDAQVRELALELQERDAREEKQRVDAKKRKAEERSRMVKLAGIFASAAGGALVGMWHGRSEDVDGNLFVPRTSLPMAPFVGLAASGLSFFFGKGPAGEIALDASNGFLAGATALYFRKHTAAGKAQNKFWAGLPSGLPELVGPQTHNHPSIGSAPTYLPAPQSMTDAELAASLRRSL